MTLERQAGCTWAGSGDGPALGDNEQEGVKEHSQGWLE